MNHHDITELLRETDEARRQALRERADTIRRQTVGDAVHLRGLLEISNHCARHCAYCGLHAGNASIPRYRMTPDEIYEGARQAAAYGFGTVVLQSGEDAGFTQSIIETIIRRIKDETPLAVTLSLGERTDAELAAWRSAGADRYLLRFETSDNELYERIHPSLPHRKSDRMRQLQMLRSLGYEIGSGVMIGIPGQSFDSLANDIERFRELDLDMIGVGPFIAHPDTALGAGRGFPPHTDQVPASEDMALKVIAVTRLICPQANIPSTTALATIDKAAGYESGLAWGANVIMPNLTPLHCKRLYQIYPSKICIEEPPENVVPMIRRRILSAGRTIGSGPGGRRH